MYPIPMLISLLSIVLFFFVIDELSSVTLECIPRIRGKLSEGERSGLPISDLVKERLEAHVTKIVAKLPDDLQTVIAAKS